MSTPTLYTLVNFRAATPLLESFDHVCRLSGKTRTQLLAEMMRHRVSTVGSRLPAKLAKDQSISERLKGAVADQPATPSINPRREWSIGVGGRLKKFSEIEMPEAGSCSPRP